MAEKETRYAIRNIGRRPLSLTFRSHTERVLPKTTSPYYTESEWNDGFAKAQIEKFIKDREAVIVNELTTAKTTAKKSGDKEVN